MGERRDLLLNSESPVTDLLLSNLKPPVTDGIIDISDSPTGRLVLLGVFSYTLFLTGSKHFTNYVFWGEKGGVGLN